MPVQHRLAAADAYAKALAASSRDATFEAPKHLTNDVVSRVGQWRAATEEWDTSTAEMTIMVRGELASDDGGPSVVIISFSFDSSDGIISVEAREERGR
jgi:hypothetical protein|tara:strand:+ start:66 stop:362 length:297 start_codon:yes stop_codon:yes gene_type:complete